LRVCVRGHSLVCFCLVDYLKPSPRINFFVCLMTKKEEELALMSDSTGKRKVGKAVASRLYGLLHSISVS